MKAIMTMTIIRIEIAIMIKPMQEMHSALLRAKNIVLIFFNNNAGNT